MMKKSFKYLLMAGLVVGLATSESAWASSSISYTSDTVDAVKAAETLAKLSSGVWPVIDITSTPAHAVVAIEQKLIRKRTGMESEVKDAIRRRLSLDWKKPIGGEITTEGTTKKDEESEETGKSTKPKRVDGKLSKVKIKTEEATGNAEGGLVGEGADGEVKDDGKTSTRDLSEKQREGYVSSAGSLSDQEKYELQRQYQEQEEAIRMLALASALRSSIDGKLMPMMEAAEDHYNKTATKEDLDPKNKKPNVKSKKLEEADQNQAIRDYTYYSVIYDQLLSLEQQVIGLRLQAKGGLAEQSTEPVIEIEYTDE